jgi:hypothetical protein
MQLACSSLFAGTHGKKVIWLLLCTDRRQIKHSKPKEGYDI